MFQLGDVAGGIYGSHRLRLYDTGVPLHSHEVRSASLAVE